MLLVSRCSRILILSAVWWSTPSAAIPILAAAIKRATSFPATEFERRSLFPYRFSGHPNRGVRGVHWTPLSTQCLLKKAEIYSNANDCETKTNYELLKSIWTHHFFIGGFVPVVSKASPHLCLVSAAIVRINVHVKIQWNQYIKIQMNQPQIWQWRPDDSRFSRRESPLAIYCSDTCKNRDWMFFLSRFLLLVDNNLYL
jgi:hypothetical protein